MRTNSDFDYRRQRFHIYIANQDSSTVLALCKEWKNRAFQDGHIPFAYMEWYSTVTDNDSKLQEYDKYISIGGNSMESLFDTYPVKFKQDIYILLFEPYLPPLFWNKIFTELYLTKQFGDGFCFVKGYNECKLPVLTGKNIKDFPDILKKKYHRTLIDKTRSLNKFQLLI